MPPAGCLELLPDEDVRYCFDTLFCSMSQCDASAAGGAAGVSAAVAAAAAAAMAALAVAPR
jgi:hypothetical protein